MESPYKCDRLFLREHVCLEKQSIGVWLRLAASFPQVTRGFQHQVVEGGGAGKLIALLKAGPNHPATPHAARALQALACRHPGAQVSFTVAVSDAIGR